MHSGEPVCKQKTIKSVNNAKRNDALNARLEYQTKRIRDLYETIEDYEGMERDNTEYIRHLEEQEASLGKDIEKMISVFDEQGTDSLDVLGRVLEHTTPNDTETNDRRKFIKRWLSDTISS